MKVAIIAKARNGPMIAYRQRFGLNQTKAAELAGIHLGAWLNLECMKFNKVTVKHINKVADTLGVHPNVVAPPEIRGEHLKWAEIAFADIDARYLLDHIGNPQLLSHEIDLPAEEKVQIDELKKELSGVLLTLTSRERKTIEMLFGIGGDEPKTIREVSEIFGVNKARVGKIRANALRKLQHPVRAERVEGFLDNLEKLPKGDQLEYDE